MSNTNKKVCWSFKVPLINLTTVGVSDILNEAKTIHKAGDHELRLEK